MPYRTSIWLSLICLVSVISSACAVDFTIPAYGPVENATTGSTLAKQIIAGQATITISDADAATGAGADLVAALTSMHNRRQMAETIWTKATAGSDLTATYTTTWLQTGGSRPAIATTQNVSSSPLTFSMIRQPGLVFAEVYAPVTAKTAPTVIDGFWFHQMTDGVILSTEKEALNRQVGASGGYTWSMVERFTLIGSWSDAGRLDRCATIPGLFVVDDPGVTAIPMVTRAGVTGWDLDKVTIGVNQGNGGFFTVTGYPSGSHDSSRVFAFAGSSSAFMATPIPDTTLPLHQRNMPLSSVSNLRILGDTALGNCGFIRVKMNNGEYRFFSDGVVLPQGELTWTAPTEQLAHPHDLFRGWYRVYDAVHVQEGAAVVTGTFTRAPGEGAIVFNVSLAALTDAAGLPSWATDALGLVPSDTSQDVAAAIDAAVTAAGNSPVPVQRLTKSRKGSTALTYYRAVLAETGSVPNAEQSTAFGAATTTKVGQTTDGVANVGSSTVSYGQQDITGDSGPRSGGPKLDLHIGAGFDGTRVSNTSADELREAAKAMNAQIAADQRALSLQAKATRDAKTDVAQPGSRPDYGTWKPGMPTAKPVTKAGDLSIEQAIVQLSNELAEDSEGGKKAKITKQDYKKAQIHPAGLLPADVVPPWGPSDTVDTEAPDFAGRGDGDNPTVAKPNAGWKICGLPFYDHDGDGDLDRYQSTDPYDGGYTHLRIRWDLMKRTFFIRTGLSAGAQAWSAQVGFRKKFNPADDMDHISKQAAFSVAGLKIRKDGSVKSEEIVLWGNDTTFMLNHVETKKRLGITIWRKWFYGPSLENMLVRGNPGLSSTDPSGANTWIFRLMYSGGPVPSQSVDNPQAADQAKRTETRTWYLRNDGTETYDPADPNIKQVVPGTKWITKVEVETSVWLTDCEIDPTMRGTFAQQGKIGTVAFTPIALPNPPECAVVYTVQKTDYKDGLIPDPDKPKTESTFYHPNSLYKLSYTTFLWPLDAVTGLPIATATPRTEKVEEFQLDVINKFDNDPYDDLDAGPITLENRGQWINLTTGQPFPFESQWLKIAHGAPNTWLVPHFPTTVTLFEGTVAQPSDETKAVKIDSYRYDQVVYDEQNEQERVTRTEEPANECWMWGVTDYLPDVNEDGRRDEKDDGMSLVRKLFDGQINDPEVLLTLQMDAFLAEFERAYAAGSNAELFAQDIMAAHWSMDAQMFALAPMLGSLDAAMMVAATAVQLSDAILEAGDDLTNDMEEQLGGYSQFAQWAILGGGYLGVMAAASTIKYTVGPLVSLYTSIAGAMANDNHSPIDVADSSWMPWYVKRNKVYGGGGIAINSAAVKNDSSIASNLGIDGRFPMITTTGSALRAESSGIVEFVLNSNMSLVRSGASDWTYFMGQPMATTYYYRGKNHGGFASTPGGFPTNGSAEIDVRDSEERNLRGDRIYTVDSGFGFYIIKGQVRRYFNEWQQLRLLREMWTWDFMTPPSRKIVQLWNNEDPNSPLLNTALPTRLAVNLNAPDLNWVEGDADTMVASRFQAQADKTRRTVGDVASDSTDIAFKASIASGTETTRQAFIDGIVQRRANLREVPAVFVFSAMRGREWEKEMAKRMPTGTRLFCVEWEDRDTIQGEFQEVGLGVEFVESTVYRDRSAVEQTKGRNTSAREGGRTEQQVYGWIASTFLGVAPINHGRGDYGRDTSISSKEGGSMFSSIALLLSMAQDAKALVATTDEKEAFLAFGASPYLVHDFDGKPSMLVDRSDRTDYTVTGLSGSKETHPLVWSEDRRSKVLIADPASSYVGAVLAETKYSYSVPYDVIELRHPMLVYYNDETSSSYVHYGVRCNPKDIFGDRWDAHLSPSQMLAKQTFDAEKIRRMNFESSWSKDAIALKNIHAAIYASQDNLWRQYIAMEEPVLPAPPGVEPVAPIEPTKPTLPLPQQPATVAAPGSGLRNWDVYGGSASYTFPATKAEVPATAMTDYPMSWAPWNAGTDGPRQFINVFATSSSPVNVTVKKGEPVWVSYVGGLWRGWNGTGLFNPDTHDKEWNWMNVYVNGTVTNPQHTQSNPRKYNLSASSSTVGFKINDSGYHDNTGSVIYRVTESPLTPDDLRVMTPADQRQAWLNGVDRYDYTQTGWLRSVKGGALHVWRGADTDSDAMYPMGGGGKNSSAVLYGHVTAAANRGSNFYCYDEWYGYRVSDDVNVFVKNWHSSAAWTHPAGEFKVYTSNDNNNLRVGWAKYESKTWKYYGLGPIAFPMTVAFYNRRYDAAVKAKTDWYQGIYTERAANIAAWQAYAQYQEDMAQYMADMANYAAAWNAYNEAYVQYLTDAAEFPGKHAVWQAQKDAYDVAAANLAAYNVLKSQAESYITHKTWWVNAVSTESPLPGVEWLDAANMAVMTTVTDPANMPETPIWQAYKWIIDPSYYPPPSGTKDFQALRIPTQFTM